jgi:polyisoprenoid-binding protein YceI
MTHTTTDLKTSAPKETDMATATQTLSGTYVLDRDHFSLQLAIEHMKVSTFRASFGDVNGRLVADGEGISLERGAPVESISIKAPAELREMVVGDLLQGDDQGEAEG